MEEIAPGVLVATSPLYLTTTSVVIGDGGGCLVIDPAVTPAELAGMGEWLDSHALRPAVGWATHPHWDHVLWSRALGASAPRYATAPAAAAAGRARQKMLADAEAEAPGHDPDQIGRLTAVPGTGEVIPWDGPRAEILAHDGHAPGHAAIWLPGPGVLVAGDMLSDVEIPLLDTAAADPLGDYRAGLRLLASLPDVKLLVPGHGHVGDAATLRATAAADHGYLDAIEAGRPVTDPRLLGPNAAWLRAEHEKQRVLGSNQPSSPGRER
jgi:glyoxylase-like metal-dependent hydrolase (beta-lactamase superfamily II)